MPRVVGKPEAILCGDAPAVAHPVYLARITNGQRPLVEDGVPIYYRCSMCDGFVSVVTTPPTALSDSARELTG